MSQSLDSGKSIGFPDGLLINGQVHSTFTGDQGNFYILNYAQILKDRSTFQLYKFFFYQQFCTLFSGKTYMFRISNVGLSTSINFRIQGHKLKLVEVEGSHTIQNVYDSLDVHVGQSVAVLVTLNQVPKDYYIVASTRFTQTVLNTTAVLHYTNSHSPALGPLPAPPVDKYDWSMKQAITYR